MHYCRNLYKISSSKLIFNTNSKMSTFYNKINQRLLTNPFYTKGEVIHGFGRGSKELGIPTANFAEDVVDHLPSDVQTGIYYGWARVDDGEVHKMVLSVGWNPYFKNEKKSMETHIMHEFDADFYGACLRILITGYLRPEENYNSLDELITAIQNDINNAKNNLDSPDQINLKNYEEMMTKQE